MAQLVTARIGRPGAPIDWMRETVEERGEFHSKGVLHSIVYVLRHRKKFLAFDVSRLH